MQEENIRWLPTDKGLDVGLVVGSPLYKEVYGDHPPQESAPRMAAPPQGKQLKCERGITPEQRAKRVDRLATYYQRVEDRWEDEGYDANPFECGGLDHSIVGATEDEVGPTNQPGGPSLGWRAAHAVVDTSDPKAPRNGFMPRKVR